MTYAWTIEEQMQLPLKKYTYGTTFSGAGGTSLGLEYLNRFQNIFYNELDPKQIALYTLNLHPKYSFDMPIQDLLKEDLSDKPDMFDLDVLQASPPCFNGEALVVTDKGTTEIKDIVVGDKVLTHTGSYRDVTTVMRKSVTNTLEVKVQGAVPITTTKEHPFYVRTMYRGSSAKQRFFKEPEWKEAKDLSITRVNGVNVTHDYIQVPIIKTEVLPSNDVLIPAGLHKHTVDLTDPNLYYLIGRWLGNGRVRFKESQDNKKNRYDFIICCAFDDLDELTDAFKATGLTFNITKQRTAYRVTTSSKELVYFIKQFGSSAKTKRLTSVLLNLPIKYAEQVIQGYIDTDGNVTNEVVNMASTSLALLTGIQALIYKVYKVPTSLVVRDHGGRTSCVIEGQVCNLSVTYSLSFHHKPKVKQGFYDNDLHCMWLPFRGSMPKYHKAIDVYNLSVEEDESYTVYNLGVHNCSLYSVANLKSGGMKGQSSSKFNCSESAGHCQVIDELYQPAIELCKKLKPKVFIIENVVGLTFKKNKVYIDDIYDRLNKLGYKTLHKVVKGAEIGLPQKRNRVFFVSVRSDVDFNSFNLDFNEPKVLIKDITYTDEPLRPLTAHKLNILVDYEYRDRDCGKINERVSGKRSGFNTNLPIFDEDLFNTVTTKSDSNVIVHKVGEGFTFTPPTPQQLIQAQSFPLDYNFNNRSIYYALGMSVAPLMIAKIIEKVEAEILEPFYESEV